MDSAFWWCMLLVLIISFSPRKFGIYTEKVGIIAFVGCCEFHCTKFTLILLLELKGYWSKVKVFLNAVVVGFLMVGLKKLCCIRKWCWVGLCSKVGQKSILQECSFALSKMLSNILWKNTLLKKSSSWKEHLMRRAFWQRILKSIFEKPREHSLKNALLHTFDAAL